MESKILTPLQKDLLTAFFRSPLGSSYYLTGGTALAAFYLQHRLSEDLDLFTLDNTAFEQIGYEMGVIAEQLKCVFELGIVSTSLRQFTFISSTDTVRVDCVREIGPQFGEKRTIDDIIVDSPENIGANKITAILSRTASKDFVDLYFLIQKGYSFAELFEMAREKDLGLNKFYLALMIRQIGKVSHLPKMLKPLELGTLRSFYFELADQLLREIKPE